MALRSPQYYCDANPRDRAVNFALVPWFDSQCVSDDDDLMPCVHDNRLPDNIPLFELKCDSFWSHMCALETELEMLAHRRLSVRARFVKVCGSHWAVLSGKISLVEAAGLDLSFARSDSKYMFCRWSALALEDISPPFGEGFFCQRRGVLNISQFVMDEIYARPSIPVDFRNIPKTLQY